MKKILLLSTGGTIASVASDAGLVPKETGEELIKMLGKLPYDIQVRDILQLDSSNIQQEEWKFIARGCSTASEVDSSTRTKVMSFMLKNINIPVVLTGSQVPINVVLSDAHDNLRLAFAAAATCPPDVYLAFHNKVMLGCRSVKVRTTNFDAFESVNVPPVATVSSDGLVFNSEHFQREHDGQPTLNTKINSHVSLVKLFPGFDPNLLFAMVNSGCRGIVIEAYGLGGMNFIRRNMVAAIGKLIRQGIPVVASSQCLYERSDLTKYEVGREALLEGAISACDMTSESAITKLMWALGQGMDVHQIADFFDTNVAGEVTLK